MNTNITTVDEYVETSPKEVQERLCQLRQLIKEIAPEAVESISYGMPAYKLHKKPLVYFAAFAHHIGFYATPTTNAHFKPLLTAYKIGKGSIQFPLNQPLPFDLIAEMVIFKKEEILKS